MAVGNYLSFEEVRRNPRLLGRFIKERIAGGHGKGDQARFESTLTSMVRNSEPVSKTSSADCAADYNETRTPKDTSEGTS